MDFHRIGSKRDVRHVDFLLISESLGAQEVELQTLSNQKILKPVIFSK